MRIPYDVHMKVFRERENAGHTQNMMMTAGEKQEEAADGRAFYFFLWSWSQAGSLPASHAADAATLQGLQGQVRAGSGSVS